MTSAERIAVKKQEYRRQGYWGDATLLDYWRMAVLSAPDKMAVVDLQGTSYTYAELDEASGRFANYLNDMGIMPGDFISIQLPGWAEFTLAYIACLKVGAVINPICPSYRTKDMIYILNKCKTKILIVPNEFRTCYYSANCDLLNDSVPSLQQIVKVAKYGKQTSGTTLAAVLESYPNLTAVAQRNADDLAAVLFTSGTEGFPKGVMLTHNNIIAAEKSLAAKVNFNAFDVLLMPAPVGHATGFHHGVTLPFMHAATSVLQDIFKPHASLELIERYRCTCGMGATPFVHDMFDVLKQKPFDISSLRFFLCGGAPVPRQLVQKAIASGFKVLGVYGSTESVPHTACSLLDPVDKIVATDGSAVTGVEIKVVDENRHPTSKGEEASRGPSVFVGYLNEPELTAKVLDDEGWYYSGDLCSLDEQGYLRITGRKKDMIVRGGENISSREIEDILRQHPAIREAAVVAMPDLRLGEKVCAFLVLSDSNEKPGLEDLLEFFIRMDIPKYKCPERLEFLDQLPRTESGKVQKFVLRDLIRGKLAHEQLTPELG